MRATRYVDLEAVAAGAAARPAPVAATEQCARRGLVVGEVHDENCHAAGGVTGHAGVFGQAGDVGRFADAVVRAWHGARDAVFAPEVVRGFCRRAGPAGSTRALGWDTPSAGVGASQAGDRWPREDAVGHMGFTGTSLWVDLRGARWVVLLTNRVHPLRADERIKAVRPLLMGTVFRSLEVSA
jgi:CubicO group peptidase (beta-lactamase class C family)